MKYIKLISVLIVGLLCQIKFASGQSNYRYLDIEVKSVLGPLKSAELHFFKLQKTFQARDGKISVNVPSDFYIISISAPKYKSKEIYVNLLRDTTIQAVLQSIDGSLLIEEVDVTGRNSNKVKTFQSDIEMMNSSTVERLPSLLGEQDIIRAIQLLPGITANVEGSSEMNVRGGSPDQNLILMDGVPLYNSSHLFGMYSSFNPLIVSEATVYKGAFPSSYGGKLSSVIDVRTRDPRLDKFAGDIDLGITSVKGALDIPLLDGKSSMMIAGRRTFYDLLSKTFGQGESELVNFYSANLSWKFRPDPKNNFRLNIFAEGDYMGLKEHDWGSRISEVKKSQKAGSLSWTRVISEQMTNSALLWFSNYAADLTEEKRIPNSLSYRYEFRAPIRDIGFKNILNWQIDTSWNITGGVEYGYHSFEAGRFHGDEDGENFNHISYSRLMAHELSTFFSGKWESGALRLEAGLRNNIYRTNRETYISLEPRINGYYGVSEETTLKWGYARMTQPVHRLMNSGLGMPLDIFMSSSEFTAPQQAHIFSFGMAKDFYLGRDLYTFSGDAFYKKMNKIISFNDGYDTRSVIYNANGGAFRADNILDALTIGEGKSLGAEIMAEKKTGSLNGWLSYTWSKTDNRYDELNEGQWFSALQDRRHVFNLFANINITRRWHFSLTYMFLSGQPVNIPAYIFPSMEIGADNGLVISDTHYMYGHEGRNSSRMKDFHKVDVNTGINYTMGNAKGQINIGLYNALNRRNASFYYLGTSSEDRTPVVKSVSMFPIMPSISFRLQF